MSINISSCILISDLTFKISFLSDSAILVPPGSLVVINGILFFFKYFSNSKICDDLPLASGPSKVINKPFF